MPTIDKIFTLEITPEQFLNSCSLVELYEIELLLESAVKRKEKLISDDIIKNIEDKI